MQVAEETRRAETVRHWAYSVIMMMCTTQSLGLGYDIREATPP